jgi:hypothetical protein
MQQNDDFVEWKQARKRLNLCPEDLRRTLSLSEKDL